MQLNIRCLLQIFLWLVIKLLQGDISYDVRTKELWSIARYMR